MIESGGFKKDPETGTFYHPDRPSDVSYSDDPAFEAGLLKIVSSARDLSIGSTELESHIRDWPSFYHLTYSRANLLRPVEHLLRGRVLEVGAGCGAITRFLGETGAEITAVEGSPRRAHIAAQRCRDLPNVSVYVDNLFRFTSDQPFDAIVCVGVLEYCNLYSREPDNLRSALTKMRALLGDSGILLIAIENQLGLKYLAGAPEDHVGQPYYGVCGLYTPDGPLTLGRLDWIRSLAESGLPYREFLYPFPDYKSPSLVVREAGLRLIGEQLASVIRDECTRRAFQYRSQFPENMAWSVAARNGLVGDLANSFLILAGTRQLCDSVFDGQLAWKYATDRLPEFCKQAVFAQMAVGDIQVRSSRLFSSCPARRGDYRQVVGDSPLLPGVKYSDALYSIVTRCGWTIDHVRAWAEGWLRFLDGHLQGPARDVLPPNFTDCVPKNIVVSHNGTLTPFDLEYVADTAVPADYVRFRGFFQAFASLKTCSAPDPEVPLNVGDLTAKVLRAAGYDFPEERLAACLKLEAEFMEAIRGIPATTAETSLRTVALNTLSVTSAQGLAVPAPGGPLNCRVYWRDSATGYNESAVIAQAARADGQPCRLTLTIPPLMTNGEVRLRVDLSDRKVLMRLDALRVCDTAGQVLWQWDGDFRSLRNLPHKDTAFYGNPFASTGAVLLFGSDDPHLEIPSDPSFSARLAGGGPVVIEGAFFDSLDFLLLKSADAITATLEELRKRLDDLAASSASYERTQAALNRRIDSVQLDAKAGLELRGRVEALALSSASYERTQAALSRRVDAVQLDAKAANLGLRDLYESRTWKSLLWLGKLALDVARGSHNVIRVLRSAMSRLGPGSTDAVAITIDFPPPGKETVLHGRTEILGWAAARTGVSRLEILLGGRPLRNVEYGLHRIDVGAHLPDFVGSRESGFRALVDATEFKPGRYELRLIATSRSGRVGELTRQVAIDWRTAYEIWRERNPLDEAGRSEIERRMQLFSYNPLISIVCPVYNTPERVLRACIDSVRCQIYPNWELILADDASDRPDVRTLLAELAGEDERIRVYSLPKNGGIAAATNEALAHAKGDFVAFLDHDDELAPNALYEVAAELNADRAWDLFYSDEDKITEDGRYIDAFFKPDWSPDLLLAVNYICHFLVCRRSLLEAVGGLRTGFDGSQDYDLALRLIEHTSRVRRIPKVLYHWRISANSTAGATDQKPHASVAGLRALEEHLSRTAPGATATGAISEPLPRTLSDSGKARGGDHHPKRRKSAAYGRSQERTRQQHVSQTIASSWSIIRNTAWSRLCGKFRGGRSPAGTLGLPRTPV